MEFVGSSIEKLSRFLVLPSLADDEEEDEEGEDEKKKKAREEKKEEPRHVTPKSSSQPVQKPFKADPSSSPLSSSPARPSPLSAPTSPEKPSEEVCFKSIMRGV